jgi:hypothetical protein
LTFDHPAFEPYHALIDALGLVHGWPTLDALNTLAVEYGIQQSRGLPLHFERPEGRLGARDYESRILKTGIVPTRPDNAHDALNALVWLRFPHFKAALNAAHGEAFAHETGSLRGRRRDALTMLDESGIWVISRDPVLPEMLRARAWQALFWTARARVDEAMRFIVVGHALMEKLLTPYPSITGKCLLLDKAAFDGNTETAAVAALQTIDTPHLLPPLPVQGVPRWDAANAVAAYYANVEVFRPARRSLP